MEKEKEELTLEESFAKLDEMLERLEDRELPLEESFRLYQQGMELLKHCRRKDRYSRKENSYYEWGWRI